MAAVATQDKLHAEPVGIVISRGKRDEPAPMFWAYVWGPAPEMDANATEPKAA